MKPDVNDFLILIGLGLIGYGLWRIWPPIAFVAIGVVIFLFGMAGAKGDKE